MVMIKVIVKAEIFALNIRSEELIHFKNESLVVYLYL